MLLLIHIYQLVKYFARHLLPLNTHDGDKKINLYAEGVVRGQYLILPEKNSFEKNANRPITGHSFDASTNQSRSFEKNSFLAR